MTRVARAFSFLFLVAVAGATATPGAAQASAGAQLLDVQLSAPAVSVAGVSHRDVVVRLHLTSPTGIERHTNVPLTGFNYPSVTFARTVAGRGQVSVAPNGPAFVLESGTAQDGWWAGTVHVTAGYDGTFAITNVALLDTNLDPRAQGINAQLTVVGSDIPRLLIRQSPNPVTEGQSLSLHGTLTFAGTGVAVPAKRVRINVDTGCADALAGTGVATDQVGQWHESFPSWDGNELNCAYVYDTVDGSASAAYGDDVIEYVGLVHFDPRFRYVVSARMPARVSASAASVLVTGKSLAIGQFVYLQRYAGGRWVTVLGDRVHRSGRFSFGANPPRGVHRYRVLLGRGPHGQVASSSAVIVVTAV